MSILQLILKEIRHRKLNALLSLLSILTAVAFFVAYFTTAEASRRETTRITRDIGFNLRIIPKSTDMDIFWTTGFSDRTMPEATLERLAGYKNVFLSYNHLVASLQRRFELAGKTVLLTGLSPTITAPAQRKQPAMACFADGEVAGASSRAMSPGSKAARPAGDWARRKASMFRSGMTSLPPS